MKPAILNIEPQGYSEEARQILKDIGGLVEREVSRQELLSIVPDYNVLITRLGHRIDEAVLCAGKRLQVVVTPTTGLDHIDLGCLQKSGIHLIALKGETEFLKTVTATAEHTWGLLLSLIRKIPDSVVDVRNGNWRRDRYRGRELSNKCLGIIGYGRLGKIVAQYGLAFNMQVLVYDPFVGPVNQRIESTDLDALLRRADIVTLHIPLDEKNKSSYDADIFNCMKNGSYFINTSRGALIDENALLEALQSGKLAGAALDVICNEKQGQGLESPLIDYANKNGNLIITPHVGGATLDSMWKTEVFVAEKLKRWYMDFDFT